MGTLALLLVVAGAFLVKDQVVLWLFQRRLRAACPECEVRPQGLDVGWRQARCDSLVFKLLLGTPPQVWSGRISSLRVAYDPAKLFARQLDGIREGWAAVERVTGPAFLLENGEVGIGRPAGSADLVVSAKCSHVRIAGKDLTQIAGRALLRKDGLTVTGLQGLFADGLVSVNGEAAFGAPGFRMEGVLEMIGLNAAELVRIFDFGERIQATGAFSGQFSFIFDGSRFLALSGGLLNKAGGRVHVIEAPALPDVVLDTATNIVVESLKNYYYDRGELSVSLEERNVKIDFMLDGPAGRRDITVVWHGPEEGSRHEKRD